MSSRIEQDFTFPAAIHYEDSFLLNLYTISLSISVHTDTPREQQISIDRIEYLIKYMIQNSIFIDDSLEEQIIKYAYAGINV